MRLARKRNLPPAKNIKLQFSLRFLLYLIFRNFKLRGINSLAFCDHEKYKRSPGGFDMISLMENSCGILKRRNLGSI